MKTRRIRVTERDTGIRLFIPQDASEKEIRKLKTDFLQALSK